MIKAHKIRLNPTPEQADYLRRAVGTRRFISNWALDHWQQDYAAYQAAQATDAYQHAIKQPTAMTLKQQFNAIREKDYPWTYDVTKCVVEGAFFDLGDAFKRFFAGQNQYPQFKKKGKSHESFYIANDKLTIGDHWVQIPVLGDFILTQRETKGTQTDPIKNRMTYKRQLGRINLAENLRYVTALDHPTPGKRRNKRKQVVCGSVKIVGATVSLKGDQPRTGSASHPVPWSRIAPVFGTGLDETQKTPVDNGKTNWGD